MGSCCIAQGLQQVPCDDLDGWAEGSGGRVPCDDLDGWAEGSEGRLTREQKYVYLQLIDLVIQQKLTQQCKAIILQIIIIMSLML